MDDLERWYRILELQPGASSAEIKRAWRDLIKVWHPDRFQDDPRMEAKAEEKLKAINEAYNRLAAAEPADDRPNSQKGRPPDGNAAPVNQPRTMTCLTCSRPLKPGVRFCGSCGAPAESPGPRPQTAAELAAQERVGREGSTRRPLSLFSKCALWWVGITFVVLAIPYAYRHPTSPIGLVGWAIDIGIAMVLNGLIFGGITALIIRFFRWCLGRPA